MRKDKRGNLMRIIMEGGVNLVKLVAVAVEEAGIKQDFGFVSPDKMA
jgi:hypothetical protein